MPNETQLLAIANQDESNCVGERSHGTIAIHIAKHLAAASKEHAEKLRPHLECNVKRFEAAGDYGYQQHDECCCFHDEQENLLLFPAGLAPRLAAELRCEGYEVEVRDFTWWERLSDIDHSLLDNPEIDHARQTLLTAVSQSPRGQLAVRRRNRADVVGKVCRLFPVDSILIVVMNREEEQHFAARLSEQLDRPVYTNANRSFSPSDKVFVVSTSIFSCVNDLDWDIIIFASPEAVVSQDGFRRAQNLEYQLLYCITPPEYQADRHTRLRLETICGPVIWSDAEPRAPVNVVVATSPSLSVRNGLTRLARKSQTVWSNDQRNDSIAELAKAIAGGDTQTFSRRSENLAQLLAPLATSNPRIAILVDSSEHGREIAKRMPDWELITAMPDKDGLIEDSSGPNHMEIITESMAAMDGLDADVIVVASGCPSIAREFPPQRPEPVLIVDFADEFDEQARNETEQRIQGYARLGWTVHREPNADQGGEK